MRKSPSDAGWSDPRQSYHGLVAVRTRPFLAGSDLQPHEGQRVSLLLREEGAAGIQ